MTPSGSVDGRAHADWLTSSDARLNAVKFFVDLGYAKLLPPRRNRKERGGPSNDVYGQYFLKRINCFVSLEVLERPLPKPTTEEYVDARLLEALVEAKLALELLNRGIVRNAAGKAFQAWKALLAALLRLELDKLLQRAKTEEEKKWLTEKAVPRMPTARMKALSQMLEEAGHQGISFATSMALDLHDYQYHGPDPDMALSKYRTREEAAKDVVLLIAELARRVEALKARIKWSGELEEASNALMRELDRSGGRG